MAESRHLNLKDATTGDPKEKERDAPTNVLDANDRRTIRQAIMTHLMREVADEVMASGLNLDGSLAAAYSKNLLPKLRSLITDPEAAFNRVRDQLFVSRDFGSINMVVFRNAMAIGVEEKDVNVEEVARRAVIRSGMSGYHRKSTKGFAGCK
jgi:hypothetical protein